jgi:hypothetical protein
MWFYVLGYRGEPVLETGMRLAPGERQSGDGTSLPETPNNLTNVLPKKKRPLTKNHTKIHR